MKKLKIIVLILFCTLFISFSLTTIYAHSGRTDSSGGHYNRSTGEYHYHHGYSAHQHPNGICPYSNTNNNDTTNSTPSSKNSENNTTKDETSNKSSSKNYNEIIEKIHEEEKTNTKNNDNEFLGWLCFAIFGSITGLAIYQSQKESKK